MDLYLGWLQRYEQDEKEDSPLGLILCADKCDEHVELLMLNRGNIRVAQYCTELPSKEYFQKKLRKVLEAANIRMDQGKRGLAAGNKGLCLSDGRAEIRGRQRRETHH